MAKRQGRKSAAQTPAPPKERIFGSKKNPKGSASSEKTASKIQLSDQIIKTLEKKLKEFKEKYPSKKNVTLADLKAVFRRGAGAYSKSHRPFITGGVPNSRNAWAFARVNKFLKKAGGQKVKAAYVQDDDLLKREDGGEVYAKGGLIAPNGKPSNLTPEQYKLVRTPQFKAWFGDWENDPENASKVVDENGEPLVVWHAGTKDFNVFDLSKSIGSQTFHFGTIGQALHRLIYRVEEEGFDLSKYTNVDVNILSEEYDIYWDIVYYIFLSAYLSKKELEKFFDIYLENYDLGRRNIFAKNDLPYNKKIIESLELNLDYGSIKNYLSRYNIKPYFLSIKDLGETYDQVGWEDFEFKHDGYIYLNEYEGNKQEYSYVLQNPNLIKLADGTNTTFDIDSDDIRYAKGGMVKDFDKTFIDSLSNDIIYHTDAMEQGAWMDYDEPESVSIKNVKKFINKIFNTEWNNGGLKNIPETFKLYRVVFLKDEKELKTDFLGYHWVRDEKLVKTHITDMMGQFNIFPTHKNMQYMIIADFKKDDIDIYWTVYNNVSVDHEEEVTIKKDAKPINYKLVKFYAKGGEIDPKVLRERWAKKKDALENLANNIQRLRTNLSKDLKEGDEKERLTALVVKVMDETGERVGNDVSADNGHFGVTGLKKKHIKVNGSNLKFKYTGKSGVEHEKDINDSTLANAMREAINNSPSEYVFETSDGFRIKNDRVNRYLNRFDVSAKDLRGYSANKWIITRLKSVKDREILGDAKKRKTKFNEIVKDVAEKVGHGRATLKKHYLLPSLEREFINHGKIVDLSNIKRTYEDGGEIDSNSSAKRGKLLDKYAFADKYMGNVSKVARKIQSTKDFENANELEFKLYRLLDDWAENTNDRNANQLYRKKEIIEKLKKQYPKIFQVPKNTIVYRGLGFYSDDSKSYGGKNLNYYLQLFLKDFNFDDVVKIKGNNWENFYFIKRPISYIEKRNVQSWTTDWKTAVSFGEEGIIMVKKTNDEFFMNPELLNSISRSDENEVLHFGKQIKDAYILISDTALEKISNKFDELGIKKSKRINEVSKQFDKGGILKRLAPGFYEGTYKGVKFTITQQEENAYGGKPMWYFQIENGSVDDLFFTKAQTLEAVKYFIDNSSKYAKGGKTDDEVNTGFDALANLETEPLNELADVPNDGLGIYDKGGKTQYSDGVSKLVNKESIEHIIPTFDEDDINWFKLVHSKDLINQVLENIGIPIKVKYELGEGSYGTAWMTENDTVLKLTKNGAEAYSSYIIFKNQENFRSQAEIYNIFIINDYSKVDVQRIYFIEKQFLNPFQDSKASSISHIYNDIEATATATKYSNNDRLEMLENIIRDENLSDQQSIYARQVFALAKDVDKEARAYGINLGDNHTGNVGFDNSGKLLCYDCAHVGNKKLNKGGNLKNENMENLKVGGEISQEEKKEIYAKWKKLVNMSKSELQKFYDSEEGKQAGLTPEEAKAEGIDSGRESARWVMKMKDTKVADWTPTMWMWAKKQISFVSRMSGNKGKLVDENGKKTRKYLSLLIWGNDPNKKAGGGDIDEPCHVCSMNDAQYQNLPALGEMADGKRFVYRESVFAKGGDTMSHVGDRYLILECMGEGGITDTLNLKVIQSSSPALLVGSVINRPIRNIINKGREMGTTFGQNIVGSYKKGGELNPDNKAVKNYFEHKSGSAGGLLVGKRHSEGGIKAINNSTGQPLEMEGGEVVITRDAVSDPTPVEFEGKKMTKREVLSEINQSGGGVAFADGGVVGEKNA